MPEPASLTGSQTDLPFRPRPEADIYALSAGGPYLAYDVPLGGTIIYDTRLQQRAYALHPPIWPAIGGTVVVPNGTYRTVRSVKLLSGGFFTRLTQPDGNWVDVDLPCVYVEVE